MSIEYENENWMNIIFDVDQSEIGQRLGVPFMRAQADSIDININLLNKSSSTTTTSSSSTTTTSSSSTSTSTSTSSTSSFDIDNLKVSINQTSMGLLGISSVVWDAGLYLIDFLIHEYNYMNVNNCNKLGRVLDIGCGTGICGIIAAYLNTDYVLLSDAHINDIMLQNIEQIPNNIQSKIKTIQYNWDDEKIPEILVYSSLSEENNVWDNIICSDLLYDSKYHTSLLRLISNLHFNRLILSYKRRHDNEEKKFFQLLNDKYSIKLVKSDTIDLKNLNKVSLSGLHLLIITPKN